MNTMLRYMCSFVSKAIAWHIALLGLMTMLLSSCGFTQLESYPAKWPSVVKESCAKLSGTYMYFGNFSPLAKQGAPVSPGFDSWIFGKRVNDKASQGDYVTLEHDMRNDTVRASFFKSSGELIGNLTESRHCGPDGYLRKTQYDSAGEMMQGNVEIRSNLLVTDNGSLVVHTRRLTDARTLLVLPASGVYETWVEFKKKN